MKPNCKFLLEGKGIGRACGKDEDCSCRYWGHSCWLDEEIEKERVRRLNQGRPTGATVRPDEWDFGGELKKVVFYDDDGEPQ